RDSGAGSAGTTPAADVWATLPRRCRPRAGRGGSGGAGTASSPGRPGSVDVRNEEKEVSSTNTRWAPRRAALFYPGPFRVLPTRNGALIPLNRAPLGLLAAPAQGRQHLPDVAGMVTNPELLVDQSGHPRQSPEIGRVPSSKRPPHQKPNELVLLARGQP